MTSPDRARQFAALHVKGQPLILFNAWDCGSAKAIAKAGAPAIATTSWAVAAAHGYPDGEAIPAALAEAILTRIVGAVDLPVSVDVEGGYSEAPDAVAAHVARLLDAGVVGINFEDRVVQGKGLYGIEVQCRRIAAIRAAAEARGVALFINARTDLFFHSGIALPEAMAQARARATAYRAAGASGLFVPGLVDLDSIRDLCASTELPLNVMTEPQLPPVPALAQAGVARISHGPSAWFHAMAAVESAARGVYAPVA